MKDIEKTADESGDESTEANDSGIETPDNAEDPAEDSPAEDLQAGPDDSEADSDDSGASSGDFEADSDDLQAGPDDLEAAPDPDSEERDDAGSAIIEAAGDEESTGIEYSGIETPDNAEDPAEDSPAEDLKADPDDSGASSDDSKAGPDDSEADSDDSGASSGDFEADSDDLKAASDDSKAGPDDSGVRSDDSEADSDDSQAGPDDSGVRSDDSKAGPDDSGASSGDFEADSDDLQAGPDDLEAAPDPDSEERDDAGSAIIEAAGDEESTGPEYSGTETAAMNTSPDTSGLNESLYPEYDDESEFTDESFADGIDGEGACNIEDGVNLDEFTDDDYDDDDFTEVAEDEMKQVFLEDEISGPGATAVLKEKVDAVLEDIIVNGIPRRSQVKSESNDHHERAIRVPLQVYARVTKGSRVARALTRNISSTGIYLEAMTLAIASPGDKVLVEISLPGHVEPIWTQAFVARDESTEGFPSIGLAFEKLADAERQAIEDFVAASINQEDINNRESQVDTP